ncbi:hypothetical protein Leryth_022425 [Lithospermum erythrorhizon]|nr:hypothetical protein Leryth_022425 [Lithospermum erythrorhizon]
MNSTWILSLPLVLNLLIGVLRLEINSSKLRYGILLAKKVRAIHLSSYYRGALGAILVYDITRKTTFENLKKWLRELREFAASDIVIVLVGNKSDLNQSRQVEVEDGQSFAQLEGLSFLETSAKEKLNVEEAFLEMINKIYNVMSLKTLEAKSNELSMPSILQGKKEIIKIDDDQVYETKQTGSVCCSY